tara:strand:+ start:735 stop:2156 length:1422 start_codon:yes stop_codon:yes gene_type:complete
MSVVGQVREQWIANIGLARPDIMNRYYKQYGNQDYSLYDLIQDHGMMVTTDREEHSHFEEGKLLGNDTVKGAHTAGTAGALKTVVVNFQTLGGVTDQVYTLANDTVWVKGTGGEYVQAVVQAVRKNAGDYDLDLIPLETGVAIPALADGVTIINNSNAFGEGTGQPNGRKEAMDIETAYLQIIKTTFAITGTAKTEGEYLESNSIYEGNTLIKSAYGREGNFSFNKEQIGAEMRHKLAISQALLDGVQATNTAAQTDADGNKRRTTEGAFSFGESRGNTLSVPVGTFTLNHFDEMEIYGATVRSNGPQMVFAGLPRQQEFNKLFKSEFGSTTAIPMLDKWRNPDLKGYEEMSMRVSQNFKLYTSTRNTYMFASMDMVDNPETYGAAGFADKYGAKALVMPFGKTKDKQSGKAIPYFGVAHKSKGGYDRSMEVWDNGSAKSVNRIGPDDVHDIYIRSHAGSKYACGKQWQVITG